MIQHKEGRLTGSVTCCEGTVFKKNMLLNERWKEKMKGRRGIRSKQLLDELKETSGYRKLKRQQKITLCREIALGKAGNRLYYEWIYLC